MRARIDGVELPYRGPFGEQRPASLEALALPPKPMAARDGLRPLKAWRYVGVYGPELMLCAGSVRIGPARQSFWAVWDRRTRQLTHRTLLGPGSSRAVSLPLGHVRIRSPHINVDLVLEETDG